MALKTSVIKRSLGQWLDYLEENSPQVIKLDLENINLVAHWLDLKVSNATVITVGGTNGKGSTVNALECIYYTAGYKVGSYTSPHLIDFNERIKINLKPIKDHELCEAFEFINAGRKSVPLSYFEMTTLAALYHFKQQELDVIILEVGLGGRLDATNIIDSDLAIITTIDYDHQEYLGTTLEAIAYEKSGIIRPDTPFIYADVHCPNSILEVAGSLKAPIYLYDNDFFYKEFEEEWSFITSGTQITGLPKPLIQLKSASAAIKASCLLQQVLPVSTSNLHFAMTTIFVPGRLQLQDSTKEKVRVLFDVSHNPHSAHLLAKTLTTINKEKVHAVFSILKDKDILGLLTAVKDCIDYWYPAQLNNKRAPTGDHLLSLCKKAEIMVDICYTSPFIAFEEALARSVAGDLIVVFGSFFTVSHVLSSQQALLERKGIL